MADSSATTSQNNGVGNIPRKPLRQDPSSSTEPLSTVTPSIEVNQGESALDHKSPAISPTYGSNVVDQPIQEVSFLPG
jgi:hypothetical protein